MSQNKLKFESCVSCEICFYNRENECSLCRICNGENMFQPITQSEIDTIDLALRNENSQMRYYLDLNPALTRGKYENIENTSAACQPA